MAVNCSLIIKSFRKHSLLGLFTAVILTLSLSQGSHAHTALVDTKPQNGEVLNTAPELITLDFGKPLLLTVATIETVSSDGGNNKRALTLPSQRKNERFELDPPKLNNGRYKIEWKGLSDDGHVMSGSFSFIIDSQE